MREIFCEAYLGLIPKRCHVNDLGASCSFIHKVCEKSERDRQSQKKKRIRVIADNKSLWLG